MHERRIWPNGRRYLWTDAFGVVLLVSLYHVLGEERYLDQAEWVVAEVDHHYLAMWMFALGCLGAVRDGYRERAVALARAIHPRFVVRGRGVTWKMLEDLSGP
jgi:hypothetical protein